MHTAQAAYVLLCRSVVRAWLLQVHMSIAVHFVHVFMYSARAVVHALVAICAARDRTQPVADAR
eukprot:1773768-Alexandrium_andersonii.AAC.1